MLRAWLCATLAALALVFVMAGAAFALTGHATDASRPAARTASALRVRDEGHLHYVSDNATQIIDEGHVSGTIPGEGRVQFTYNGSPNVSARFTIHGAHGSISGEARAKLSNPSTLTPSFSGDLTITGGSGRYTHAHGRGKLYGVFHRHGYGLIMQAIGELRT
ncbi:MAG: hypothetical protein ACRDK7_10215 [Solirubrobacteraceae bacterium]